MNSVKNSRESSGEVFYLLSDVERAIFVLNKSSKDGFLKDGSREAPPKGCKR